MNDHEPVQLSYSLMTTEDKREFCLLLNKLFDTNEDIDELVKKLDELNERQKERDRVVKLLDSYFYHE